MYFVSFVSLSFFTTKLLCFQAFQWMSHVIPAIDSIHSVSDNLSNFHYSTVPISDFPLCCVFLFLQYTDLCDLNSPQLRRVFPISLGAALTGPLRRTL